MSGVAEGHEEYRSLRRSDRLKGAVEPEVESSVSSSESEEVGVESNCFGIGSFVDPDKEVELTVESVEESDSEMSKRDRKEEESKDLGVAEVMRVFLEDHAKREEVAAQRREEAEAVGLEEERRVREEERKEREDEARNNRDLQQRLMETLIDKSTAAREATNAIVLPHLKEEDELEEFVSVFETALELNEIPRGLWKNKLISNLPLKTLARISDTLKSDGSSYNDVICALRGNSMLTFGSVAEDLCSGERGRIYELDVRPSANRMKHLVKAVAGDACSVDEMAEAITVALLRDHLVLILSMLSN